VRRLATKIADLLRSRELPSETSFESNSRIAEVSPFRSPFDSEEILRLVASTRRRHEQSWKRPTLRAFHDSITSWSTTNRLQTRTRPSGRSNAIFKYVLSFWSYLRLIKRGHFRLLNEMATSPQRWLIENIVGFIVRITPPVHDITLLLSQSMVGSSRCAHVWR